MLIGQVAQRLVEPDVLRVEAELEREVADAETDVRFEPREVTARLQALERRLAR